jgi:hypothetical protein
MYRSVVLRALLRLCRIPNVFTACANVLAGILLVRGGSLQLNDGLLVAASAALYTGGMILNDFFDRRVDARERPDRPIPAGQVSPSLAAVLGVGLLAAGIGFSAANGRRPAEVAIALALAILLYDAGFKATPLGPIAMGSCRFLNVLLGMSVSWPEGVLWLAPAAMGLLTVLITVLSRDEVAGGGVGRTRWVVVLLTGLAAIVAAGVGVLAARARPDFPTFGLLCAAPFFAYLLVRGRQNFAPLWHDASPPVLGRAIGGGILLMPSLDATLVAAAGVPLGALAVMALTIPAALLKRWYYLT